MSAPIFFFYEFDTINVGGAEFLALYTFDQPINQSGSAHAPLKDHISYYCISKSLRWRQGYNEYSLAEPGPTEQGVVLTARTEQGVVLTAYEQ